MNLGNGHDLESFSQPDSFPTRCNECLRETLAKGEVPAGCVTWCTEDQICELRNLAEKQKITKAFGLICLAAPGRQEPPHVQAVKHKLPAVNTAGQAGLGEFWAVPLSEQFPQLPSCSTCSRAPKVERTLVTLRVQVPQRLIQTDGWNNLVRSPAAILRSVIPPTDFHSTFKWAQVTHKTKFGGAEVVLEGYAKVDQACVFDLFRKSGSKGLFFTQIAKDNLQVFLGSSWWQISNVWTVQDVVRCLEGAGCEDTTVVRRPSKRQPWIVLSRVQKQFQNVQVFGIESNGIYITLSNPPPKPSITGTQAVAAGAWKHKDTPSALLNKKVPLDQAKQQVPAATRCLKITNRYGQLMTKKLRSPQQAGSPSPSLTGLQRSNKMVNGFVGCPWKQWQSDVTLAS